MSKKHLVLAASFAGALLTGCAHDEHHGRRGQQQAIHECGHMGSAMSPGNKEHKRAAAKHDMGRGDKMMAGCAMMGDKGQAENDEQTNEKDGHADHSQHRN